MYFFIFPFVKKTGNGDILLKHGYTVDVLDPYSFVMWVINHIQIFIVYSKDPLTFKNTPLPIPVVYGNPAFI